MYKWIVLFLLWALVVIFFQVAAVKALGDSVTITLELDWIDGQAPTIHGVPNVR